MENDLLTEDLIKEEVTSTPETDLNIPTQENKEEVSTPLESEPAVENLVPHKEEIFEKMGKVVEKAEKVEPKEVKEAEEFKEAKEIEEEKQVEADIIDHVESWGHYLNILSFERPLPPVVKDLIFWRDVKQSGAVLGGSLAVLISLAYCSVISVLATSLLLLLLSALLFRIYSYILQALHKTSEGHPFKTLLEIDLKVDAEEVKKLVDQGVPVFNTTVERLRAMFLVEDLVDSFKLGLVLWLLTYVGSWFNGLTLVILAVVVAFSVPKIYLTYRAEIDTFLALALTQIKETYTNVRAKIPIGNKKKDE